MGKGRVRSRRDEGKDVNTIRKTNGKNGDKMSALFEITKFGSEEEKYLSLFKQ